MKSFPKHILTIILAAIAVSGCQQDLFETDGVISDKECLKLQFKCADMLPQYFDPTYNTTRAATPKTNEEKMIKTLHVFFFSNRANSEGKHPLAQITEGHNMESAYVRYDVNDLSNVKSYEREAFANETDGIIICAVANVYGDRFLTQAIDESEYDSYSDAIQTVDIEASKEANAEKIANNEEDGLVKTKPMVVTCLEDLQEWIYAPKPRDEKDISNLPEPGMPMLSEPYPINDVSMASFEEITMKALMARVEVNISLDPDQTNHPSDWNNPDIGALPKLTITKYGIKNMASTVPFSMPKTTDLKVGTDVSTLDDEYDGCLTRLNYGNKRSMVMTEPATDSPHEIDPNRNPGPITFTYYTYENIQGTRTGYEYPSGVNEDTDEDKQRWKPRLLSDTDNATALVLYGTYVTDQNITYEATFTVYMGGNTFDNFDVKRNHCYTNNITIYGLDYVRNSDENLYTFDARVNLHSSEENVWYISIVNERQVDAHASVLPMDIYMLLHEGDYQIGMDDIEEETVDVWLYDPDKQTSADAPAWIRMEMVPGYVMQYGNKDKSKYQGNTDNPYDYEKFYDNNTYELREGFDEEANPSHESSAGLGARKYFDEDLLTNPNKLANNTERTIDRKTFGPRTRIYFYIDENVPVTNNLQDIIPDRTATIYLKYHSKYKDKDGLMKEINRSRKIEIDQKGLLLVSHQHKSDNKIYYFYIEYYEEYLSHSDPLDKHEMPAELYEGLPWGLYGTTISYFSLDGSGNYVRNYHEGRRATQRVVGLVSNINTIHLYNTSSPVSAFHYVYGKNKRSTTGDGSVPTSGRTGYWELPGIRDLESAMTQYYATFTDFQGPFYWSASPASTGNTYLSEQNNYARATKIININPVEYAESGANNENNPGWQSRNNINRIRAVYKTNAQNNQ